MADVEVTTDWRTDVQRGFFLGKRDDQFGRLDFIAFDLVESESHTSESEVTDFPVESGAPVSDHVIDKPDELELVVMVSDVSMRPGGEFPSNDPFTSIVSRSTTAWLLLKALKAAKEPLDYQSGLELYQNMVIVRLSARQTKDEGAALIATIGLRSVRIVGTEKVTYPPRKAGKSHRQASKTVAAGEKKTEAADKEKSKTLLKQMADSFRADPSKALGALGF